ncbi:MAG: type II toxin-antitoxin system VapC family toxin [Patulibacter sp.]
MRYLDTSAVTKLLVPEAHSVELAGAVRVGVPNASSALLEVELLRAVSRRIPERTSKARAVLAAIQLLPIDAAVVAQAAVVAPPELRSLDAIHLATALTIRDVLTEFVTYDRQLGLAAQAAGLPVRAPGIGLE